MTDYNNLINKRFNSLFGRDAAPEGQAYWGNALSDPTSGITTDNLNDALVNGASEKDLAYYNYSQRPKTGDIILGGDPGTDTNSGTTGSGILGSIENPFSNNAQSTNPLYGTSSGLSLSMVEPYQPDSTYQAPDAWRPDENDLVQGRMDGLLNSGSQYMQSAKESGLRTAQSRGLLNSSLAAGQSQAAAIEAALPIAQQDSQSLVDAGMTGYEGKIQGELARQGYDQSLGTISAQEGASSRLSAQENDAASDLSYQNYLQGSELTKLEGDISSQLKDQEHNQAMALDWQQQEGYNYRTLVEADLQSQIAAAELASKEKAAFADSMQVFGEKFQNDLSGINADTKMNSNTKTNAIASAQEAYLSNLQYLSSIYGVDISWQTIDTRSAEQAAYDEKLAAAKTKAEAEADAKAKAQVERDAFWEPLRMV